jgi:hypothetical protein
MRTRSATVLCLIIILCLSKASMAQSPSQSTPQSADTLREKIEQLEKTEMTSRSATVQEMYKRTLARLYAEFSKAVEDDISDLKKIEATIRGAQSENNSEVAAQLKKLITERDVVNEKLKTLADDSESVVSKFSAESSRMLASTAPAALLVNQPANGFRSVANSFVSAVSGSPAPAAAVVAGPIQVQGNVNVKNNGQSVHAQNVTVVLSKVSATGEREKKAQTITDMNGDYSLALSDEPGQYIVTASVDNFAADLPVTVVATPSNNNGVDLELLVRPMGEFSRAIVGLEQAGASSAKSTQRFFMDLTLSAPLPWGKVDPFFGRRLRSWGSARITSVPQQITSGVAEFAGAFAQKVGEVKVNELAQGMEFLAGGEYRLTGSGPSRFGTFGAESSTRFTLSFIVGGGVTTPFNPRDTLEVFKVFRDAPGLPEVPDGKDFLAFVSPDRDRFFRQFYGGFRLQTYYFDYRNPDIPLKRYPATLDITYGQNEAVTGGRLRGGVIRLEGFYPLPYDKLKFINLFGTAMIKPARTKITDPLILEAAPAGTTLPADNVFLHTVPQINRDYYRVGVGIDFMSLISKWKAAKP